MRSDEELVLHAADEHLQSVWSQVMEEWQATTRHPGRRRRVALVTRDCSECGTRVRVGALISPLSPRRPAGDRAYCASCRRVTHSPVVEVRGLVITDDEEPDSTGT